ncbi:hypothetical protein KSP39_PZI002026 [Platanthera zijinensis]|uniref:Uncharacterized protein n=1 Tax=Platanthera zijinensis TaxID=2320716 RepID=A0AAP0GET8_9ASPA
MSGNYRGVHRRQQQVRFGIRVISQNPGYLWLHQLPSSEERQGVVLSLRYLLLQLSSRWRGLSLFSWSTFLAEFSARMALSCDWSLIILRQMLLMVLLVFLTSYYQMLCC